MSSDKIPRVFLSLVAIAFILYGFVHYNLSDPDGIESEPNKLVLVKDILCIVLGVAYLIYREAVREYNRNKKP
ncbi:MAG TPA: hypothetical protein VGQ53_11705 [Chitinophagaceae bacterium]|jgi:uncharacterized membrane protein|nr:hypothetical protein [Chitinophagaceae bacterium]